MTVRLLAATLLIGIPMGLHADNSVVTHWKSSTVSSYQLVQLGYTVAGVSDDFGRATETLVLQKGSSVFKCVTFTSKEMCWKMVEPYTLKSGPNK